MQNQIYRLPNVMAITGMSRSTIYALMSKDQFPKQVSLSRRCVGWKKDEIDEWISSKKPER